MINPYKDKGNLKRLIDEYQQKLIDRPNRAAYHLMVGLAYAESNNKDEAAPYIRKALVFFERGAYAQIAQSLERLGMYEEVAEGYEQALLSGKTSIDALSQRDILKNLLSVYIKLGRPKKLAEAYSSLIQLGELDELSCGVIMRGLSMEEAKEFVAKHAESSNPMLCIVLGDIFPSTGERERAIQMYQRAVELSPNDPQIRAVLGKYYFGRKHYAEAAKAYSKAAELDPNQPFYQIYLAYSHNGLGEHEKAIELGRRLVKDATDSDAHIILGTIYLNARRYEDAVVEYEKALTLWEEQDKHSEFLICALATVYDELGRMKDADAVYVKTKTWHSFRGRLKSSSVRCSFCNKSKDEVQKLIAGPNSVFICDECVKLCVDILRD